MNTINSLYLFGKKPQSYGLNHRAELPLTSLSEFNGRYTSTTLTSPHKENRYPSRVTISISSDGDHFVPVYDQAYTRERLNVVGTRTVTYQGKKQKARFVRISAKEDNPGEWVFTDEVKVY